MLAKKDKAVLLPVGSILKSPLGLLFLVLETNFINAYSTLVHGELIHQPDETEDDQTEPMVIEPICGDKSSPNSQLSVDAVVVTTGALPWPAIGWDIQHLPGEMEPLTLSYLDPIIPPPVNACVHSSQSEDDLIFMLREFKRSGEENSRRLSSAEYDVHIVDCEDIILLGAFLRTIILLHHAWKIELEKIREEEGIIADSVKYPPSGLPHNYSNETIFVEQLGKCT